MSALERLFRDLRDEQGAVESAPEAGPGVYSMSAYRGEALDPPARLTVQERDLDALLESHQGPGGAQSVFPDRDPWTAAYFLFLAHFDEEIARYGYKIKAMTVGPTGVRGTPRDDYDPRPLPPGMKLSDFGRPGEFRWTANPPNN